MRTDGVGGTLPRIHPGALHSTQNADRSAALNPQRSNRIEKSENSKTVKYAGYEGDEDIHRAIQAGASGYLLKGLSSQDLASAIQTVHNGGRVLPEALALRFKEREQRKGLSTRELQVLQQIVLGRSNKEIASEMQLGEESVKTYLRSLFQKLGVVDRTQAAVEAIRQGIVHL